MQHLSDVPSPVKGRGGHAKHLEVIEYVGFNAGKAGPCRRRVVGFHGKRDVLVLHKPVVPFGRAALSAYPRILGADRIESVVLRRVCQWLARAACSLLRALIDERKAAPFTVASK